MDNFHAVKTVLQSGAVKTQHAHGTNELNTIPQLGCFLHDKLPVKDNNAETSDSPSNNDGSSDTKDENASNHNLNMGNCRNSTTMATKCLQKSATFSVSSSSERNELESQLHDSNCCSRSLSMPTVGKLVSAIKGSREKEGLPQKKLSVTWTPDVYDPIPTSVSHFPKKKNQQQYSKSHKKHGKGKQKGKNTRGGGNGPKEKKHHRKSTAGRSDRCSDSYLDTEKVHDYQSSLELCDYNDPGVGGPAPEANCGSKLLGQASGTMHCVY